MANKDKYRKQLFRLVFILNKLDSGRISSSEIAEEFNVSLRTIQRDMDFLNVAGFPLSSPERGSYTFAEGFSLKKANLTGEEASLLSFLFDMAKSLGKDFEKPCSNLINKIMQQEYETPFYAKLPQGPMQKLESPSIKTLEDAVCNFQKVIITYEISGGLKKYKLCPLKIAFYDGFWYLLAQKDTKEGVIKFRIDKIKDTAAQDGYFVPPKNLQTMLDESVNIWFSEFEPSKVLLHIDKEVASYFRQRVYFPKQKITEENKDGSLIVETQITDKMEILPTVMYWIPYVTVVEPQTLQKELKETLRGYLKD
jgi:predicted DNA-binding transcriptional regulator YafY